MDKREFLKKMGLLTAGGMVAGSLKPATAASMVGMGGKEIGLQIYSVMRELNADVPNGLKKIKDIGYSTIELAGYGNRRMGEYSVEEYRKLADDAGLKITGSHVNPPTRDITKDKLGELSDFWKQTVEDHEKFGVKTLVQPMMPNVPTHDAAKVVCESFNHAGEIAKSAGIKFGYHNHNMEFGRVVKPEDKDKPHNPWMPVGDVIYDLFLNGTDPNLVFFEMDVYWTVMGANDPLEYFEKYAGRFPVLHIKDRSVLGQSGMMNFENIFNKAYENGLEGFYVELEGIRDGSMTQFEGVEKCYDYLNDASFVKQS
ncbi:sugar phosphate isomerase/epimerase family protein [Draconibacterium halophilum]|uniref:Sugar phosphate isomerase/epimerase n=1 Tax=Draconibacterium halophilum TaxID=2706887 RepID=A0A6C0R9E6_9BACT|nr:sugar phosphate isomerase/epimerase [Draconibacterium halophilum]QIA06737.1 sugar phosphate isomerase/epimerase [Draconibacterium halophilum]